MCAAQHLKRYYDPEDLCGEEWELNDEEIAALDLQIRQIVNSQSQDRAKKAQHKQVHSTSTVNCSETFTSNTNQVPGTSVLNSSHQFNVVFASKAKQRQLVLSVSQKCCVKI